ncbi:MAG TPA: hypothetical protein VL463_22880 [Kofleriaceae bacterium]|nr:hypothetical protein [Kofleriaceae bacterium]
MSQFVESGINEKLDDAGAAPGAPAPTTVQLTPRPSFLGAQPTRPITQAPVRPAPFSPPPPAPRREAVMTSAAARFAVEPPPPIIKPRPVEQEPKAPAEPTPGQIFTF